MSIVTDSTPLEAPKDPDACNAFKIYHLIAGPEQSALMRDNYIKGGYGYGHAKTAIFELLLDKYKDQRTEYNRLMENPDLLEKELAIGEAKAAKIANEKLKLVREVLGYN
jgi:tryptophanyl-tRNA synthetase